MEYTLTFDGPFKEADLVFFQFLIQRCVIDAEECCGVLFCQRRVAPTKNADASQGPTGLIFMGRKYLNLKVRVFFFLSEERFTRGIEMVLSPSWRLYVPTKSSFR